MTGDLGPGENRSDDLSAVFVPYVAAAAGLAVERDDDQAAAVLGHLDRVEVRLGDAPVTAAAGQTRLGVEVVLHVSDDVPEDAERDQRLIELLDQTAQPDGYRVRRVEVRGEPI
jgi:hypothetical protein